MFSENVCRLSPLVQSYTRYQWQIMESLFKRIDELNGEELHELEEAKNRLEFLMKNGEELPVSDQAKFPDVLSVLEAKQKAGFTFIKDELIFLYDLSLHTSEQGIDKPPDSNDSFRLTALKSSRDVKRDLAFVFGCTQEQISFTLDEALAGNIRFHYGNLDLRNLTSTEGLTLPVSIGGSLNLSDLTSAEGLTLPVSIGGSLNLSDLTSAEGLIFPTSVGGHLYLSSLTSSEGLTVPVRVGGSLELQSLTLAEGLTLPVSIGEDLNLTSLTSAKGLIFSLSIGGDLNLQSLASTDGLILPTSIGGHLGLDGLTSTEGLILPTSVGGEVRLSLNSVQKQLLRARYPLLKIS